MKATKVYLSIMATITAIFAFVLLDALSLKKEPLNSQKEYSKLTKIIEPALGVSINESRFLHLTKEINRVYPELKTPSKIGFIYAK